MAPGSVKGINHKQFDPEGCKCWTLLGRGHRFGFNFLSFDDNTFQFGFVTSTLTLHHVYQSGSFHPPPDLGKVSSCQLQFRFGEQFRNAGPAEDSLQCRQSTVPH